MVSGPGQICVFMISAVIFFTVANPATFRLMRRMLGKWVSSPNGCPSIRGLALHSAVFLLIVWGLMQVKPIEKESYAGEEGGMPGDAAVETMKTMKTMKTT